MTRRDPSILPYGPTANMLRDSDPEKACSIKCYSTDSKEVRILSSASPQIARRCCFWEYDDEEDFVERKKFVTLRSS